MHDGGTEHVGLSIALPPDIEAPGRARRFAVDASNSAIGSPALEPPGVDALRLLVSEVVANVVVHARTPMHLQAMVQAGCVRVEVTDDLPPDPELRPGEGESYGLRLVAALASGWGVIPTREGKTVWFEVRDQNGASPRSGRR